ncbi:Retrovirus-related Pol polyprotein from transposon TNT 1-94 [Vitis vinifera]|uniref:Retrovirus-related Pol polyprotein from transposon TNT 1-94 n=1 Tax=Vitis vinifera TaxID=29760 RepID=A0A438CSN5_VITVI|nr:Retrovirus-related Pol polyprotein from transposon TNT 1-94 [Vitis vinifera]
MDVKTKFLNGNLEEEVYMKQPEGFSSSGGEHLVCKLKKSIYGLKQASRQWCLKFHDVIASFGFMENIMDQCIYQKVSGSKICFLVLYVDDILLATNDKGLLHEVQFGQCPKNDLEREQMKNIPYAYAVGSLMYKPLESCKEGDEVPSGTKDYMLMYRRTDNLVVIGYSDLDSTGCIDSRKSTSGYVFMLVGGVVYWKSAKQTLIATSTMEAEPLKIYCDNSVAVFMAKNNKSRSRNKHIDIKCGNNRELGTKHEELGTWNMLLEDVCYLLRGWNVLYEMKIKFNILGTCMEDRICCKGCGTLIVTPN